MSSFERRQTALEFGDADRCLEHGVGHVAYLGIDVTAWCEEQTDIRYPDVFSQVFG